MQAIRGTWSGIAKAISCVLAFILFSFQMVWAQSDSLKFDLKDHKPFEDKKTNLIDFKDPPNVKTTYKYDPNTGNYLEIITIGGKQLGSPRVLTMSEYLKEQERRDREAYYRKKSNASTYVKGGGLVPKIVVTPEIFDKVFGGGIIDIRPSGSAEVTFGGNFNKVENPMFPVRQQRNGQFDFGMKMQLNVTGQIGDRLKLNWNYDTEATFEFENQMKLNWGGTEDDIIKNIELGNVSLPLNGSLIQGGRNLFGIKTQMQFGKTTVTAIATQDKGETRETEVTGGAQVTEFDIQASQYDANRHYFLSQYFAENYDRALENLPIINSNIMINYVEVWVTNRANAVGNTRNAMGFLDLGETNNNTFRDFYTSGSVSVPDNNATNLYRDFIRNQEYCNPSDNRLELGVDYECLSNARQLKTTEFSFHPTLGFISLNQALNNDEVLMVAYEYTVNGVQYQVGEFTVDNPQNGFQANHLNLKLLKHSNIKINLPTWDLMMKNVYSLNTYNLQQDGFTLNVVYADDPSGADLNYLPVDPTETRIREKQLITVLNLDRLNKQMEQKADGVFDVIEGVTLQSQRGAIIFPCREPFGDYLRSQFIDQETADYYVFDSLYQTTRWNAEQDLAHNKFFLRGTYKGSATDQIRLQCFNISQGSVRVTANGNLLNEGSDYIVDYTMGTVRIVNQGILNSGASIKATCESNSLINIQQKSLVGARVDYKHSDNLVLGATFMHMSERPLTPKVNIGEEPLLNSIWGVDGSWNTESRWLTRMVDKLPFIETKEKSTVSLTGEFAHLIPHKPRTMGERGTSYLDDFEGAETPYDLKFIRSWFIASTPQGQPDLFPETTNPLLADSAFNSKRAKLAWYNLDPVFQSSNPLTPEYLRTQTQERSDHFVRTIFLREVFPEIELQMGQPQQIPTLDLAFYPKEKGQFNYNVEDLQANGELENPEENWGGIMRRIETNDFEATNIDYIEIWMMDPFVYSKHNNSKHSTGELYINLGSISEDVIPDRKRSAENGLPTENNNLRGDTGTYSITPQGQIINKAFDNDPAAREVQDAGLDGMLDETERELLDAYLQQIADKHGTNSVAYIEAVQDPSSDNYLHPRDEIYSQLEAPILQCYKSFNGTDGNSTLENLPDGTPKSSNTIPDDEDINQDYSVNLNEEYYQYRIDLSPGALRIGQNFVADTFRVKAIQEDEGVLPNEITWYQLKVPVRQFEKRVGGIEDFKSIRFMRMFLKGFEDSVVLRFANLQLVRADWRRYLNTLKFPPKVGPAVDPNDESKLVVSTVNIIENSSREPVPYKVPPGFSREIDPTQPGNVQQNEQSLSIAVCDLDKEDARGAFRMLDLDIRNYKTIKMFLHAESQLAQDGDVVAIMRIGTDLENNFYQYEIPLKLTPYGTRDAASIWPTENELIIDLEDFYKVKLNRENVNSSNPNGFYSETLPNGHTISMIGLPDLSNVRTVLLGVKNAATSSQEKLCAEVWFNELRLVDFVNKGGYAANARLVTKLADFATVTVSGNYQSIGFGAIDRKLNDRNLDEMIQYDIASNVELGKFFPQKSGITIPMFIGYNENIINPKYYPLNPDIELRTAIENAPTRTERDAIREAAQDFSSRYSLNFTNVKKNRTTASKGKPSFYDIENWNYSFSYQRLFRRNQVIEMNEVKTYRSSLGYNFTNKQQYWEPFKKLIKGRKLLWIKDFNIGYAPSNLSFRVDVDRRYSELKNRNNDNFRSIIPVLYDKTFSIGRVYGWKWNLAKSLSVDYNATANSWVEEPFGALDTEEKRDTMWRNFWNLGSLQHFNQTINANYSVPLRKIKPLDWTTLSVRYSAGYEWRNAPPATVSLGNTISNSRTIGINSNLNFISLYNKSDFLRKMNRPPSRRRPSSDDDEEDKKQEISSGVRGFFKFIMMLKQAQMGITINDGTTLPGFNKTIDYLGQNFRNNTPGWPFILGVQDEELRYRIASNGYLSNDTSINTRYMQLNAVDLNGSATVEPFDGFRISISVNRRQSLNTSSNYRFSEQAGDFTDIGLTEVGQFTTSFGTWRTLFDNMDPESFVSEAFEQFKNNRFVIAQRLQTQEFTEGPYADLYGNQLNVIDDSTSFPLGFSRTHQDVLLYSFIAAYSGQNAANVQLSPFRSLPIPNWRINYNGLSKIEALKDIFSNIALSHSYSSTLNMGAFFRPLDYGTDDLARGENITTRYGFNGGISIVERLTPLLGIDVTMTNGLTLKLEYKTDRNLQLNMRNLQMVEQRNKEWVIGAGFRTSGVRLPIKYNGKKIYLSNDLNFRFDFSIRDGATIVRNIESDEYIPTAGIRSLNIRPSIDYKINDNLNFRMFYNRNANEPVTSNSFPTALTDFGITLRYTMQ